jgi:hypothetical protein
VSASTANTARRIVMDQDACCNPILFIHDSREKELGVEPVATCPGPY